MHLRNVCPHLVLAWEPAVSAPVAAIAVGHRTEEDGLLRRMGPVVVTIVVGPAPVRFVVTVWEGTAENEGVWLIRRLHGADVRLSALIGGEEPLLDREGRRWCGILRPQFVNLPAVRVIVRLNHVLLAQHCRVLLKTIQIAADVVGQLRI